MRFDCRTIIFKGSGHTVIRSCGHNILYKKKEINDKIQITKTQNKEIKEEEMESKRDEISETQNKQIKEAGRGVTPEVTVSNLAPREYKILSPLLPRTPRHIEWRRRLGQNPAFLPALEGALTNKRKELAACHQELEEDPKSKENKDKAVQLQRMVWLFEDSIHRVKSGTYHLR